LRYERERCSATIIGICCRSRGLSRDNIKKYGPTMAARSLTYSTVTHEHLSQLFQVERIKFCVLYTVHIYSLAMQYPGRAACTSFTTHKNRKPFSFSRGEPRFLKTWIATCSVGQPPPLIPSVRSMTGWDNRYAVSPFIPCTKLSKDHNAPCGLTRGPCFPRTEDKLSVFVSGFCHSQGKSRYLDIMIRKNSKTTYYSRARK
jgi:hypothetical protein